jgi:RES domain-containing protein
VLVYRASRRPRAAFDPLDLSGSTARSGWRWNDKRTEILYAAEVQSLSILEVAARPGWDRVSELAIAAITVPDGTVFDPDDLGITLPSNWNLRPVGPDSQRVGAEFLAAVDREAGLGGLGRRVCGLRVPSVISTVDHNVLLDPRQRSSYSCGAGSWARIPFNWLVGTST